MSETIEVKMRDVITEDVLQSSPLLFLLHVVWNRRAFLAKCTLAGAVLATILAFVIPKEYKSSAQLMPEKSADMSSTDLMALAAGASPTSMLAASRSSFNPLNAPDVNATFLSILNSQTAQDDIINRFDLRRVYKKRLYEDARKRLTANTEIGEDKKTNDLIITVQDKDPTRARNIVAAYIDELNKLIANESTSAAQRERIFLEGRIKELQIEFDEASRDLSNFSSRNATLNVQDQARSMLDSQAKLQESLSLTLGQLRSMQEMYAQDNVHVRALQAQADELQAQLRKLNGVDSSNNTSDLKSGELFPPLRQLPILGSRYTDLYLRFTLAEQLFGIVAKEYEVAKMEEAREIPTVRVLDPPNFPEQKSYPPRTIMVIAGAILFFCAGAVWIIAKTLWATAPSIGLKALLSDIAHDAQLDSARIFGVRRNTHSATDIGHK